MATVIVGRSTTVPYSMATAHDLPQAWEAETLGRRGCHLRSHADAFDALGRSLGTAADAQVQSE
jgi:hypothetical protein